MSWHEYGDQSSVCGVSSHLSLSGSWELNSGDGTWKVMGPVLLTTSVFLKGPAMLGMCVFCVYL